MSAIELEDFLQKHKKGRDPDCIPSVASDQELVDRYCKEYGMSFNECVEILDKMKRKIMSKSRPHPCFDCKIIVDEYYVLNKNVWDEAKGGKAYLHILCLEERLGRKLIPEDFNYAPFNQIYIDNLEYLRERTRKLQSEFNDEKDKS